MIAIRTLVSGIAGGMAANVMMFLTFRLIGFGWDGRGPLLDPSIQSPKLIAVWTQLEPRPLVVSRPMVIGLGLVLIAIGHAFIYRWLASHWPAGVLRRAWRMALLIFVLSYVFWEFFTPFNQLGEPIRLILLELLFWLLIALSEALVIAAISEHRKSSLVSR